MPTLLLIEDDAESRRATAALFDGEWKVIQAGDGEEGIQSALEHRPDVILCDLLMPKTTGFQVCRAGRQQLPPARIIVFSGRDYGVDRQSAMDAGAVQVITGAAWLTVRSAEAVAAEYVFVSLGVKVTERVCFPALSTVPAAGA